jgi:hypothetical protein
MVLQTSCPQFMFYAKYCACTGLTVGATSSLVEHCFDIAGVASSILASRTISHDAVVAQLVEHRIRNAGVVGSNPINGTSLRLLFVFKVEGCRVEAPQERRRTGWIQKRLRLGKPVSNIPRTQLATGLLPEIEINLH